MLDALIPCEVCDIIINEMACIDAPLSAVAWPTTAVAADVSEALQWRGVRRAAAVKASPTAEAAAPLTLASSL